MNEWVWLMGIGLVLDIIGIWLLASPLLKIDLTKYDTIKSKTQKRLDEWLRLKDQKVKEDGSTDLDTELVLGSTFAELDLTVYQLYKKQLEDKEKDRKKAIRALIIISIGFGLQIVGNIWQSLD